MMRYLSAITAGISLLVLVVLFTSTDIRLRASDWRCVIRDVESGRCDVYERTARTRDETNRSQ